MTDFFASKEIVFGALIDPSAGLSFGPSSVPSLGNVSFGLGAAAFTLLFIVLALKARGAASGLALFAVFSSAAWAILSTVYFVDLPVQPRHVAALEILRTASWIAFLGGLLLRDRLARRFDGVPPVLFGMPASILCLLLASVPLWSDAVTSADGLVLRSIPGVVVAIGGLVMTEILYRNTAPGQRWKIKFLCLSAGILFAYDLFFYADASLFSAVDPALHEARGAVQALCAPLIAVAASRADIWHTRLMLSHRMVIGSATMIASGVYLSLAAAAGLWLREAGGQRGDVIQIVFLVGALAVLAATLFSGAYWAHARVFVVRHFFRHKYDWREEWLRFMATLASAQELPLDERCIKAIADIVDSPGGTMVLMDDGQAQPVATWNFALPGLTRESAKRFGAGLKVSQSVIDLEQLRAGEDVPGASHVPPELLSQDRAWLVVPLWHRGLVGLVILEQPRAARGLDWEDYDLLGVVGRQVASYLAEQRAQDALEDAREFEIFNRRFAFVVHDVKNLVSQLSVLGSNFEKHGHRQEFRDDVVETLKDAASMLNRLMDRIKGFQPEESPKTEVKLTPVVRRILAARDDRDAAVTLECDPHDVAVLGDADRLEALIAHLVENAVDATNGKGAVTIGLRDEGRLAVLDVTDNGPGMTREFVQRELFRPFQSTKKRGMGLGVYQCREYAREFGGDLEVMSAPGEGTTMRVMLPIANAAVA